MPLIGTSYLHLGLPEQCCSLAPPMCTLRCRSNAQRWRLVPALPAGTCFALWPV